MKLHRSLCLFFICVLLTACHNEHELELRDLKHPDQDTIRFNIYSNIYSEDTTPQAVGVGDCVAKECKGDKLVVEIPRDYFHSTMIALDDRSFFTKQFRNVPRNYWPDISTTEHLMLLMSCTEDDCVSYPSLCTKDKLKCAKPLRRRQYPSYLNLARIDFLFYEQTGRFYSLYKPRFIWQEKELITTYDEGYKKYSGIRFVGDQYAGGKPGNHQGNGGIYFPASKDDEFFRIQCLNKDGDCEYLFHLSLDESFTKKLYGDGDKKILVRAEFENFWENGHDFERANKKISVIRNRLCEFFPCNKRGQSQ